MACEDSRIFVGELEESLNDRRAAIQEVLHNSIKDTICIYIVYMCIYVCIYIHKYTYILFVAKVQDSPYVATSLISHRPETVHLAEVQQFFSQAFDP